MWQLTSDSGTQRLYTNSATGSKSQQTMVYTDRDGNKWWNFDDLTAIPHVRTMAAQKITSLYSLGLSKDDLTAHIDGLKFILRSSDKDKYEKAFALVLDFESKANAATDAIKQMTGLTTVYFTLNDEPIDSWDNALQIKKMGLLEADTDMHTFFLSLLIDVTARYTQAFSQFSQIALPMEKEK